MSILLNSLTGKSQRLTACSLLHIQNITGNNFICVKYSTFITIGKYISNGNNLITKTTGYKEIDLKNYNHP